MVEKHFANSETADCLAGLPEGAILHTSQGIRQLFLNSYDLIVIQASRTIVHSKKDKDLGAKPFRQLVSDLLDLADKGKRQPKFFWLVSDVGDLAHVLDEMAHYDPHHFEKLNSCALVGTLNKSSDICKRIRVLSNHGHLETLTASHRGDKGYAYLGHYSPVEWQMPYDGPLCCELPNVSDDFDGLLEGLLNCICEDQIKRHTLEEFGISIFSLKDIPNTCDAQIRMI